MPVLRGFLHDAVLRNGVRRFDGGVYFNNISIVPWAGVGDRCTGLNMPYVRLIFEVAGSDGQAVTKALELQYDKFQV